MPNMLVLVETRMGRGQADNLRIELGFHNCLCIEAIGLSGGIVAMWNEDEALVLLLFETRRTLHLSIQVSGLSTKLLISVVYACTRFQERRLLWISFVRILKMWICLGL